MGVFQTVGWTLVPEVRAMVVRGKEEAVWSSAGLKISLKSESKNWLEEGGGMCDKTHCISEQVACEKPAVTGSLLCRGAPHTLGQSSLRTLFRFSGVCLASGSPSRSHLAFVCPAVQEILCFYFRFFSARYILVLYRRGSSMGPVPNRSAVELPRYVMFVWPSSQHTKTQRQWTQRLIWWIQTHLCVLGHKCGWNVFCFCFLFYVWEQKCWFERMLTSFRDLFSLWFHLCYRNVFKLQIDKSALTQKERIKQ